MNLWNRLHRSAMQSIARTSLPVLGVPKALSVTPILKEDLKRSPLDEDYVLSEAREKFDQIDESLYGKPFVGGWWWRRLRDVELQVEKGHFTHPRKEYVEFVVRRLGLRWPSKAAPIMPIHRLAAWVMRRRFNYWRKK